MGASELAESPGGTALGAALEAVAGDGPAVAGSRAAVGLFEAREHEIDSPHTNVERAIDLTK